MSSGPQAALTELDLSERLRELMRTHGLTVGEFATLAGVSKSAMEKYLAGPSSPRATAIASICQNLGANAQWLLMGIPDDDLLIVRGVIEDALSDILNELKQGGEVAEPFRQLEFGTREWRTFNYELTFSRAREAIDRIEAARERWRVELQDGGRLTSAGPFPLAVKRPEDYR